MDTIAEQFDRIVQNAKNLERYLKNEITKEEFERLTSA